MDDNTQTVDARHQEMYGCSESDIKEMMEEQSFGNPLMLAISILSDAQHIIKMKPNESRQFINRAKYVLSKQMQKGRQ